MKDLSFRLALVCRHVRVESARVSVAQQQRDACEDVEDCRRRDDRGRGRQQRTASLPLLPRRNGRHRRPAVHAEALPHAHLLTNMSDYVGLNRIKIGLNRTSQPISSDPAAQVPAKTEPTEPSTPTSIATGRAM